MKFNYIFDCGCDYKYRKYDGAEFVYELDDEDAKYFILKSEIKKLELDVNPYDLIDLFDSMYLWDHIFDEDTIEWLKGIYNWEAMSWFKDKNMIEEEE